MNKYIEKYINSLTEQSDNTVKTYTRDLKIFEDYISDNNLDISTVTLEDLQAYSRSLRDLGYAPATRNRRIQVVKYFYKYLHKVTGDITENPSEDLKLPKIPKRLPEVFTLKEAQKILDTIKKEKNEYKMIRDIAMMLIFLNLALRVNELTELELGNINGNILRLIGKGNKEREIHIPDTVLSAINEYLAIRPDVESDRLFITERNEPFSKGGIQYTVNKYLDKAGLEGYAHKLRSTSATIMLEQEVDIRTIQELLGHENIKTTERYVAVTEKKRKDAANKMNGVFY